MSTQSKTRNSFERLIRQKGATVHWHREIGGDDCPCITPEGFRDPEWHFALDQQIINISNLASLVDTPEPGQIEGGHTIDWTVVASVVTGTTGIYIPLGTRYSIGSVDPSWNPAGGYNAVFQGFTMPALAGVHGIYFLRQIDSGPLMKLAEIVSPGDFTDIEPITFDSLIEPQPWPISCNDDGKLVYDETINNFDGTVTIVHHGNLQDATVKGFVQPAFISTRSRSNQLLMQSFGELQADDHIGIFPMEFGGFALDFADWSNSGTDWIEFNDMRFIAVAWNLLPAPDNADVNHHWEVALRRVNEDEPNA